MHIFFWILTGDIEDAELTVPASEEEDDSDGLPSDPDSRSTSVLTKEAAASTGITKKRGRPEEEAETNVRPKASRKATGVALINRK